MSSLETVNRLVAGLVYDGVNQEIIASQGIASVIRSGAGTYVVTLSEQVNSERLCPIAWAGDAVLGLRHGTFPFIPGDPTRWGLIVENEATGARVDVARITWRALRLPNV